MSVINLARYGTTETPDAVRAQRRKQRSADRKLLNTERAAYNRRIAAIETGLALDAAPVAMVPQPCQQQQARASGAGAKWELAASGRRDLKNAHGVILGSVVKKYGLWDAEIPAPGAYSRHTRQFLGSFEVEADALAEVERAALGVASPKLTHIVRFTIPHSARSPEDVMSQTRVGDTAATVVEYLGTGQLDDFVLTEVYAADLTPGAESLTDVTAAILWEVAAHVEAAAIDLPRSLEDAFTRHGIPQPTAWVEAGSRDLDFEDERLGPADCLDRRRAA